MEYSAVKVDIPMTTAKEKRGNELQTGVHHTKHGEIVVMKNLDHDLPCYVITHVYITGSLCEADVIIGFLSRSIS